MLRVARTWKWLALVGLGIGALGWLVVTSSSFETCMGGAQIQQSNQSPENGATEFITALHIYKTCTGVFIDQNGGSITAIATIAIAAFTVLLTRVSNKQAELTKTTAAAVLSAELPIIFVQDIQLSEWGGYLSGSTVISEGGPPPEDCRVDITFHNYGRSVAVLTAVCIEHLVVSVLPENPTYENIRTIPPGRAIERDQSLPVVWGTGPTFRIAAEEIDRITQKSADLADLWVYGYLAFRDFRTMEHKCGFCFKWHCNQIGLDAGQKLGFHGDGPAAYHYNT